MLGRHSNQKRYFGFIKNDLDYIRDAELIEKVHHQSRFSVLYFILLSSSVLVCTLGLLINSVAVIIGGMLIAPLMWPLARTAYGISHRSPAHLYRGFLLVIASILIGAVSAYLITIISPIKVINEEIIARTAPTLMDLFIALAAGLVAAVAITQRKIADSLAGVAIAVSLMPPLCAVGILFALQNYSMGLGALLLFATNAVSITLITTLVLVLANYSKTKHVNLAKTAVAFNVLLVLLLAIPLFQLMQSYSFELQSFDTVRTTMNRYITQSDQSGAFENIRVEQLDKSSIVVYADLLIPQDTVFTYEDNESLISLLETSVGKKVLLNLRIQNIIEPISKDQENNALMIDRIRAQLSNELNNLNSSYRISSISIVNSEEGGKWLITADILTDPDAAPSRNRISDLSVEMSEQLDLEIELNLTFLPRLTLRSTDQTVLQEIEKFAETATTARVQEASISSFALTTTNEVSTVSYSILSPNLQPFDEQYMQEVKSRIESSLGRSVQLRVRLIQATDLVL